MCSLDVVFCSKNVSSQQKNLVPQDTDPNRMTVEKAEANPQSQLHYVHRMLKLRNMSILRWVPIQNKSGDVIYISPVSAAILKF